MSVDPSEPVVTTLVCHFTFAREAAGAAAPGIPCALCLGEIHARLGRIAPRDRGDVFESTKEVPSKPANRRRGHDPLRFKQWFVTCRCYGMRLRMETSITFGP